MTVDPPVSAVPSERKLVTVVFADLSGFTALASSLDPEEVYAVTRPCSGWSRSTAGPCPR